MPQLTDSDLEEIGKVYGWKMIVHDEEKTQRILRENFQPLEYFREGKEVFFLRRPGLDLYRAMLYIY